MSHHEKISFIKKALRRMRLQQGISCFVRGKKIYQTIEDAEAVKHHQLRVIDESGADYLYPEEYFVHIDLPQAAENAWLTAA